MKIVIAEDHHLVRTALSDLLYNHIDEVDIEEATNGLEAIEKVKTFAPDLVVLDYEMPQYNGIFAARAIRKDFPNLPILMLTMHAGRAEILASLQAGANGYLTKEIHTEELIAAINALAAGVNWYKGKAAEVWAKHHAPVRATRNSQNIGTLSNRQIEVIELITRGLTNEEISAKLHISIRTVEVHKWRIYQKLGINKVSDLILFAHRNYLKEPDPNSDSPIDLPL